MTMIVGVSRSLIEVLGEWNRINATTTRTVVETIAASLDTTDGELPIILRNERIAVEVIGAAAAVLTLYPIVTRTAVEVLGSGERSSKGLDGGPSYTLSTHAMVVDPVEWTVGGQFHFQGAGSTRIRIWGTSTTSTIRIQAGASFAQATFTPPAGPFRVVIRSGATPALADIRLNGAVLTKTSGGASWPASGWDQLNGSAPDTLPQAGQLAELMVWNRSLTDPEVAYIESYLLCHWITPGCNVYSDLPAPPG